MKSWRFTAGWIFLLPFFVVIANPNTVILRDGTRLQGEIINQDQTRVHLKTPPSGQVITVPKDSILKILYKDPSLKKLVDLKKQEEELEQERLEFAELYSKAITPLISESPQIEERNLLPTSEISDPVPTLGGALLRSLLFPGWGQYYQGRTMASLAFAGGAVVGIGSYYRHSQIYRSAVKDLRRLENPFSTELVLASSLGVPGVVTLEEYAGSQFGNLSDPRQILVIFPFSPIANQRKAVERHKKNVDFIGYATLLIWLANLLDVYFNHPGGGEEIGLKENLRLGSWRFFLDTTSFPFHRDNTSTIEHRLGFTLFF